MERMHSTGADEAHDVVVVGARCAGSATAMLLAQQGVDVVMVDRAEFPSDTISTHAIARGGVVQLARWGLLDEVLASGAPAIREVAFHFPGGELTRDVKDRAGVDHLVAPRRTVLDSILLDAAIEAGAEVRTGVSATGIIVDRPGRVAGVAVRDRDGARRTIRAQVVVGADGVRSRIARSVGARRIDVRPPSGATHYAYVAGLDAEGFEFHVGDRLFAGVFPTNDGQANVWVCAPADAAELGGRAEDRMSGFLDLLGRASPSLADRVRRAAVVSPIRGASGLPNHVMEAAGPGWALVGDAGYHRDPITGHGITDAFRDAELLARRLAGAVHGEEPMERALWAYTRERALALGPIFDVTCRLSEFPPVDEFVELQKRLSLLIDAEASWLADLPPVPLACRLMAA